MNHCRAVRARNLLSMSKRDWFAVLLASLCGTTLGDFVSGDLSLGFLRAAEITQA
jgi:uncharacterized membrane-anchored protein